MARNPCGQDEGCAGDRNGGVAEGPLHLVFVIVLRSPEAAMRFARMPIRDMLTHDRFCGVADERTGVKTEIHISYT